MNASQDNYIDRFIRIPIPVGTAGASIWAVATFIQKWDPAAFPNLKTVFALTGMRIYSAVVIVILAIFYLYIGFDWVRMAWLHLWVRWAEWRHPPPEGMVLVPSGDFQFRLLGNRVRLGDFFIDKYLVTNEQYAQFVKDANYPPPPSWENGGYPEPKALYPVTSVDWTDATEYCKWRSRKSGRSVGLPTEQEWEKAARGPHGYRYPWGNQFDMGRCNVGGGEGGEPNRIDQYPLGISPYGCWDMCGNVWEWTDTWFSEKEDIIVLKGGSFYFDEEFASLWIRYHDPKSDRWPDLGFRCVVRF